MGRIAQEIAGSLDNAELRSRIAIAKSVLTYAPAWRVVRKALRALDGASLEELAADREAVQEPPGEMPSEYLRGWYDGWEAGDTAAAERFGDSREVTS